ncbi:hypothetical protein A2U01_0016576, partial [Trifolium medium]|nr:hypothetical protein [Trifolium medium]
MSGRDSDSKRRRSRFDPPPQPRPNSKRCRKDGKQQRGSRVATTSNSQADDPTQ